MKTRTRFILIGLGITIFLVSAPLAVFFARGFRFNFDAGEVTQTGAIVVSSDPKGAGLFINGELVKKTPVTERFVFPGEYNIRLEKELYRPWTKNVSVNSQLITNPAQRGMQTVFLFLKTPVQEILSTSTLDFVLSQNDITAINSDYEVITHKKTSESKDVLTALPSRTKNPTITATQNQNTIVQADNSFVLANRDEQFELPPNFAQVELLSSGQVIALTNTSDLVLYDTTEKDSQILDNLVEIFTVQGEDVYYVKNQTLIRMENSQLQTVVLEDLPDFEFINLLVYPSRQIFLILDDTLFHVTSNLKKINQNVEYAILQNSDSLIYGNRTEAWLFRTQSGQNQLLERNSSGTSIPQFSYKTGYYFIKSDNKIKAIETSFDGQSNTYDLITLENDDSEFVVDENAEYLIVRDRTKLYSLKIR